MLNDEIEREIWLKKKDWYQSGLISHTCYSAHETRIIVLEDIMIQTTNQWNTKRWNRKKKIYSKKWKEKKIERMRKKLNIKK